MKSPSVQSIAPGHGLVFTDEGYNFESITVRDGVGVFLSVLKPSRSGFHSSGGYEGYRDRAGHRTRARAGHRTRARAGHRARSSKARAMLPNSANCWYTTTSMHECIFS